MAEGDLKESNIPTAIPEQKPMNIQSNILQKKKSNFEITSIRSIKSEVVNVSTVDDELDDSEIYDNNDSTLNATDSIVVPNEELEKTEVTTNGHNIPPTSRFRVIIDVNGKTFKRGRWNCRDYLEKRQDAIKSDVGIDIANEDSIINNEEGNSRQQLQQPLQTPVPLASPALPPESQIVTAPETQQQVNSSVSDCNFVKGNCGTQQQNVHHFTEDTLCEPNDVGSSEQPQYLQPTMQNLDQQSQIESNLQPTTVPEIEVSANCGNVNVNDIPGISISSDVNNVSGGNEDVCILADNDATNVNNTVAKAPAINNVGDVVNNIGREGMKEEESNDMIKKQMQPAETIATTNTLSTENVIYPNTSQAIDNNYATISTGNGPQLPTIQNVNITGNFPNTAVNNAVPPPQHRLININGLHSFC